MFVAAVLCAAPATARAADVGRPLRSLVYDVSVSIGLVRRGTRTPVGASAGGAALGPSRKSGVSLGSAPAPAHGVRGVESGDGTTVKAEGTIVVDVVAATGDGGLIADIAESAAARTRPKVRIVVAGDGTVLYAPQNAADVSEEEVTLARWLARGFYRDRPREAGVTWTVDQSSDGLYSAEHYRVLSANDRKVTLNYELEQKSAKAEAFTQARTGEIVYDTGYVVPVQMTYEARTRRQLFDVSDETRTAVVMKLTADSFVRTP